MLIGPPTQRSASVLSASRSWKSLVTKGNCSTSSVVTRKSRRFATQGHLRCDSESVHVIAACVVGQLALVMIDRLDLPICLLWMCFFSHLIQTVDLALHLKSRWLRQRGSWHVPATIRDMCAIYEPGGALSEWGPVHRNHAHTIRAKALKAWMVQMVQFVAVRLRSGTCSQGMGCCQASL
ncbi:hypothetical protein BCR44DRAFT_43238 [Catenaria anguillulae PL171]|uniref:Uncharacterized protein n=1 Tax=Catenaria anguillulae PL171 TaxID=765915 RepID=A0A1Y2HUX5_9FUNG|nr:hypothetical protein BCR44DRAFT_43238 [Catenaria anguillulae PL171]